MGRLLAVSKKEAQLRRQKSFQRILFLLFLSLILFPSGYAQSLKVVDWNLLNFPGSTGAAREVDYRTVLSRLNPDILICQEMISDSGVQQFLDNVLNSSQPGEYTAALFIDGPDTDNALFYKSGSVQLIYQAQIPTDLRDISEYVLQVSSGPSTGTDFRVYSLHLKAGATASDKNQRFQEANTLRNYLNGLPANSLFLVCGDFNLQSSDESSFTSLTDSQADNDGRLKDPINLSGTWNNNADFAKFDTQSTRATQFGGGASGGLDDRFDLILTSYAFDTDFYLRYKPDSYFSYGNDGNHFNLSINEGTNDAVGPAVADSLYYASDHLPVVLEIASPAVIYNKISGSVRIGSAGLEGVKMNGLPGNPTTDSSGLYACDVEQGWSGTVIPTKRGYLFSPASRAYASIYTDQPSQDYSASTAQLTLTIQSSPNGTMKPAPGVYSYAFNAHVLITATPDAYSALTGWTGDASGTANPLSVTMDRDKTIMANFRYIHAPVASGEKVLNRSFSQAEYIDVLSWQANPDNAGLAIAAYRIYAVSGTTSTLMTEVNADQTQYFRRKAGSGANQYAIASVVSSGQEGAPAFITVINPLENKVYNDRRPDNFSK